MKLLDGRDDVDFEYEGEMAPDVALNPALQKLYPVQPADRPGQRAGHARAADRPISRAKLLSELGGDAVIGPMLVGMKQQVQIAPMTASASDLMTLAVLAAGRIVL